MLTSLHLPDPLLQAVDRQARRLKISRNRFIVRALENELGRQSEWSPDFFEQLRPLGSRDATAVDELRDAIRRSRTSKRAPEL